MSKSERSYSAEQEMRMIAAQMVVNAGGAGFWLRHKLAEKEDPGALAAAVVTEAAVIADWLETGDASPAEALREAILAVEVERKRLADGGTS